MGMGYWANHVETISDEALAQLCPATLAAFKAVTDQGACEEGYVARFLEEQDDVDLADSLAEAGYEPEQIEAQLADIRSAYDALRDDFQAKTTLGEEHLTLWLGYHNLAEGSRYDEVDGAYWGVHGVYTLSGPGKRFRDKLTDASFVMFG